MRLTSVSRSLRTLVLVFLGSLGHRLYAQPYTFTHFVGSAGGDSYQDGSGSTARFSGPIGVAIDPAGNAYVTDYRNYVIRKISPAGLVTTFAGSLGNPGTADGIGPNARFSLPQGIAADPFGNVYVADSSANTIRKIACDGAVSTFAGQAGVAGSADGTGSAARFNFPESLATDAYGNIYVTDSNNDTVRKITPGAVVTTVAGSPGVSGSADGTGSAARFFFLFNSEAITVDSAGTLYVADYGNLTIRKIAPGGVVTTLAGTPGVYGTADGTGPAAQFENPDGIATDGTNVYVADSSTIRKITPSRVVTTIAGVPDVYGLVDGVGASARFSNPMQMVSDGTSLFVADFGNNAIRKMAFAAFAVTTLAGGSHAVFGSADGTGAAASFSGPAGMTTDGIDLYVSDQSNNTIRKVVPATGQVSTFAGSPGVSGSADGTGTAARFYYPQGITSDGANLYVSDRLNRTIRKIVIATGQVTTLAGTAGLSGSADGTGAAARFRSPLGITTDGTNLYVTDSTSNNTIRKIVIATAEVTTFAGTAGIVGSADGIGPAASFNRPTDITTDGANLYVADSGNATIRKIVIATREVTTFAGTAGVLGSADGTGSAASFTSPVGIATDGTKLYVSEGSIVRQITLSGAVVTTIGGKSGFFGATDGTGPAASFEFPRGIAIVGGNLYFGDGGNHIRQGAPAISDIAAIDSATGDRGVARQLSTTGGQASAWSWSLVTFPEGSTATFSDNSISNPTFTPDQPGFYRFWLDATGPAGRSITTVDLSALCAGFPTAPPVSNNGPICAGQTLQLTAGPVPGGLYCWTGPNGFASGLQNPSIPIATTAASGTYSLTVSVSGCTSEVVTTAATVTPPPTAAVSGSAEICAGTSTIIEAALAGVAPWSLTWSDGFVQTGILTSPATRQVSPSTTTNYSVTSVFDAYCTGAHTGNALVTVDALPATPVVSGHSAVCDGGRLRLTAFSQAASYQWYRNGTAIPGAVGSVYTLAAASGGNAGSYTVVARGASGCSSEPSTALDVSVLACAAEARELLVDPMPNGTTSDGNGVLEPGERVVMAPAWKNNGGSSLSLSGTTSLLTGPVGPTYTLFDSAASYGSISTGATANCRDAGADCYELFVSNPVTRPATHWDATVDETLSDGDPGRTWVLHVGQSFQDVPKSHVFYSFIERILHDGVTTGCGATTYCPEDFVFRLQMAVFIARAQAGGDAAVPSSGTAQGQPYNCASGGTSLFSDILPADPFCRHVHYIYSTNVTTGCEPGKYCPDPNVTRAQMALFISRAIAGSDAAVPLAYGPDPVTGRSYSCNPASPSLFFSDITTSDIFCRATHYLWAKNVISGFPDGSYGPALPVSRGAMAKFLANGFNLQLYGP